MRAAGEAHVAHDVARAAGRSWTVEDEQLLREMWSAGKSTVTIAVALDRSTPAIWKKVQKLNLRRQKTMNKGPLSSEEIERVVSLFRQGEPLKEIGRILGRSVTSISALLNKLGLRIIQPRAEPDLPTTTPEPPTQIAPAGPLYCPGDQVLVYGPVLDKRSLDQTLTDWQPATVISDNGRFVRVDHGAYTRCYHYDEVKKA